MKFTEEYKGIIMPIPKNKEEALIKMNVEKNLYEEYFGKGKMSKISHIKIYYEYDRNKALEMGADVSGLPEKLNYLETKN